MLTQGGTCSYKYGGAALPSSGHAVRLGVARTMVPHSIALGVRPLDRAAERMAS